MELKDKFTVALTAHHAAGKTSLVEAMLYSLGNLDRMGRVEDGNTFGDYTDEEKNRRMTLYSKMIVLRPKGRQINLIDTPGFSDFIGDLAAAIRVADGMLLVLNANNNVEVETERIWEYADEYKLPRMVVVNQLDKERTSLERSLEALSQAFQIPFVPLQLPIGTQGNLSGIIDLVKMKAFYFDARGKAGKAEEVPAEYAEAAAAARETLVDRAAEFDESVMEKFLEGQELSREEIIAGLRGGIAARTFVPVVCASVAKMVGISTLIDAIGDFLPSPADTRGAVGVKPGTEDEVVLPPTSDALCAYVFKATVDPFAGKLAYLRVYSGALLPEHTYLNTRKGSSTRIHAILEVNGRNTKSVQSAGPGDVVALAKLDDLVAGDTLCDDKNPIAIPPTRYPNPVIQMAVHSKNKDDEDKISQALTRIIEGDPTLNIRRDPETKEMVLVGMGELQINVAQERLKNEFKLDAEFTIPRVPYRETITVSSEGSYRHKKQTGGRGQFAEVHLRLAPKARGEGNEFLNEVVGGSVPTRFIPAVEKGVHEAQSRGFLAGYPVVDVACTVFDGKDHPVDSSEMAFKLATINCFKEVASKCRPVLLEPIMNVEIRVPDEYMGDIMGDLNTKRGRVMGMDSQGRTQIIRAQVPLAEMYRYSVDLRSIARGRGSYDMTFSHYDVVPPDVTQKVVEQYKQVGVTEEE
ncbi:elongation factor G [bacterium]|nr:elongation factor G [bacterium]